MGILNGGFNEDMNGDFVRGFYKGVTAWGLCMLISKGVINGDFTQGF